MRERPGAGPKGPESGRLGREGAVEQGARLLDALGLGRIPGLPLGQSLAEVGRGFGRSIHVEEDRPETRRGGGTVGMAVRQLSPGESERSAVVRLGGPRISLPVLCPCEKVEAVGGENR